MAGSSIRILLVEDDAPLRAILAEVLREDGYAVEEAADGRSALAAMRAAPDAIVLDLQLPHLAGPDFSRAPRDHPAEGVCRCRWSRAQHRLRMRPSAWGRAPRCASRSTWTSCSGRCTASATRRREARSQTSPARHTEARLAPATMEHAWWIG